MSDRRPRPELAIFAERARTLIGHVSYWPLLLRHADWDFNSGAMGRRIREIKDEAELLRFLRRFNWPWLTLECQDRQGRASWVALQVGDREYPATLDRLTQGRLAWDVVATLDWRRVASKYRVRSLINTTAVKGRRSDVLMWKADELRKRGATDNEIACVLPHSPVFIDKYGEGLGSHGRREIERLCARTRRLS